VGSRIGNGDGLSLERLIAIARRVTGAVVTYVVAHAGCIKVVGGREQVRAA
jgi:hypothetical protein